MGERGTDPSVNGAILQRPHQGGVRIRRNSKVEAIQERAAAEVGIIVCYYIEGRSFRWIASRLRRNRWYVANVFYSPMGQREVAEQRAMRKQLVEFLKDKIAREAQQALDKIIALSNDAQSESVRLKAAECIVEKALEDGKPGGTNVQVIVSDDALRLAINTLEEINATGKPPDDTDAEP